MRRGQRGMVGAALVLGVAVSGCRVERTGAGAGETVKVATPFGGVQVKTDDSVQASVGLPLYPGAQIVKKDKDGDSGSADVNLSFGTFQLRVKAVSLRTGDSPEKVKAFYQRALGRYGDVLECAGHRPVGRTVRTAEGLTCQEGNDGHEAVSDVGEVELKAGSAHHQHVAGIDREGAGTKVALVAVDLPEGLPMGGGTKGGKGTESPE